MEFRSLVHMMELWGLEHMTELWSLEHSGSMVEERTTSGNISRSKIFQVKMSEIGGKGLLKKLNTGSRDFFT